MIAHHTAPEIWFVTGSQHLYGPDTLKQVADDAKQVVAGLNDADAVPLKIVHKPTVTTPEEVTRTLAEASSDPACGGLILWMHTFSPAKMWIAGLKRLSKPFLHLHTQFARDIPWQSIDMDYMNLHQSAHGDREFGHICARLRLRRKVVVGHWKDERTQRQIGSWCRAADAWHDAQGAKFARFGDNMREVAVTEGDKVEAQLKFGYAVNGYGLGDLVEHVDGASDGDVDQMVQQYADTYELQKGVEKGGDKHASLRDAARIECGLRSFLESGTFKGFTDTFENLTGLKQLPGIASQRLMHDGYGFGAEGDWKHAALVRAMKVMGDGLPGGTTFMEDYTYHFDPSGPRVLGAHMLEICPSVAAGTVKCEVHPLGIGGKDDPARLVFDGASGDALNASVVDLGDRFRLLVNEVTAEAPPHDLPKLPVARVLWEPKPNLEVGAAAWIHAGGAHHTGYSLAVTTEMLEDFARMADVELVVIDGDTRLRAFERELRLLDR